MLSHTKEWPPFRPGKELLSTEDISKVIEFLLQVRKVDPGMVKTGDKKTFAIGVPAKPPNSR